MRFSTRIFALVALVAVMAIAWVATHRPDWFGTSGAAVFARLTGTAATAAGGAGGGGPSGPGGGGVPVEALPVKVGTVSRTVQAVGSLMSSESVVIRPEVAGRVVDITFDEGSRVTRGQVLLRLDDAIARAQLVQAEANLEYSRADFNRAQQLARDGATSQRTREQAAAKLQVDDAAAALARAQLEKLVLVAPFDGDIGLRKVSVGAVVQVGQDLVNLEALDPLKVDFRIPESFLPAVAVGQTVVLAVDAFPGRNFSGEVYAIDPLVDAAGRSLALRARIPNPGRVLRPGLFARLTLTLASRSDAILVPEQALVPFGNSQFVYRVVDGKVVQTRLRLGERRDGWVETLDGLSADALVVTAGQLKLRDGVPVTVLNKPAGS